MSTSELLKRAREVLWSPLGAVQPGWKRIGLRIARTLAVLFRDVTQGQLTMRAMGLVYTTLLSLVPLLALSFSVLKAFGVHNQIRPFLTRFLAPLGENSAEITDRLVGFIENMNVGVLGSVGLALLIYTSVSLIQKIEESFNYIWHIAQARSFGERFSRYTSLLLIGPILVFVALGTTATVTNADIVRRLVAIAPVGLVYGGFARVMPYLLVIGAFTFAYYFVPNTRVKPLAALVGGAVAGAAWQTAGWGFAEFVVESGRYRAIYSGFAILILFLIWLYLSWLILLLGASVAFYVQHPEYLVARSGEPRLSNRMRERLALAVASGVASRFSAGREPLAAHDMAHELGVPAHAVQVVLDALAQHGILSRVAGRSAYLPSRQLGAIAVADVLAAVRSMGEERYLAPEDLALPPGADQVQRRIDDAVAAALAGLSLDDIAEAASDASAATGTSLAENKPIRSAGDS